MFTMKLSSDVSCISLYLSTASLSLSLLFYHFLFKRFKLLMFIELLKCDSIIFTQIEMNRKTDLMDFNST